MTLSLYLMQMMLMEDYKHNRGILEWLKKKFMFH